MAKKTSNKDLHDDDILLTYINRAEKATEATKELIDTQEELLKETQKLNKANKLSTASEVKDFEEKEASAKKSLEARKFLLKKQEDAEKALSKARKERDKEQKRREAERLKSLKATAIAEKKRADEAIRNIKKLELDQKKAIDSEIKAQEKRKDRVIKEQEQASKSVQKIREIEAKKQAKIEQDRRKEINKSVEFEKREKIKLANELIKLRKKETDSAKRQADKLKAQQDKKIARQNELIQKNKAEKGSLKQLNQQLRLNIKAYDSLSKEERESEQVGKVLIKTIQKQQKELLKLEQATGRSQRKVGDYKSALTGLKGVFLKGLGILGLSSALDSIGSGLKTLTIDLGKLTNKVKLFGVQNEETSKSVANNISAISSTFGESTDEILKSANTVSKEFDITLSEALNKIELGFVAGSNASGQFLDILTEYPTQLASVGLSADESFALINQQVTKGIYSDKGVDSIKEAGLRLREMPEATKKALKAISLSSEEIELSLRNGTKSIFDVIQTVSKELGKLPPQSAKVGTAIADIFGSAGEDAGLKFLTTLSDIDLSTKNITENLNEYQKSQLELTKTQKELNKVVNDFFDDSATSFNRLKINAISFATKGLRFISDNFERIIGVVKTVATAFVTYKTIVTSTKVALRLFNKENGILSVGIPKLTGGVKNLGKSFKALNTTMKANIIGLVASSVATLIGLFSSLSESTDDATESQREFNEAQEDSIKSIDSRFNIADKLSKTSLSNLKSDIEERIRLEEELSVKLTASSLERFNALKDQSNAELELLKNTENLNQEQQSRLEFLKQFVIDAKRGINVDVQLTDQQVKLNEQLRKVNIELERRNDLNKKNKEFKDEELTEVEDDQELDKFLDEEEKKDEIREEFKNKDKKREDEFSEYLDKELEERYALEQELLDKQLEARLKAEEEEKEAIAKRKEETQQLIDDIVGFSDQIADVFNKLKISNIDDELTKNAEKREDLRKQAQDGNVDASKSLSILDEKQNELAKEREKALKNEVKLRLTIATAELILRGATVAGATKDTQTILTTVNTAVDGSFEKGGILNKGERYIEVNEKGVEAVVNAPALEKYGADTINKMNNLTYNPYDGIPNSHLNAVDTIVKEVSMAKVEEKLDKLIGKPTFDGMEFSRETGGMLVRERKGSILRRVHMEKVNSSTLLTSRR
jgi:hypothetical protein